MPVCATCGRESPDDFGFCPGCGAALTAVTAREVRKVVTVLFCDLTGSTAIGERTDPEALRALMNRSTTLRESCSSGTAAPSRSSSATR